MGVLGDDSRVGRGLARLRRGPGRRLLARQAHLADLRRIGAEAGRVAEGGGPRVLVLSLRGWTAHNVYESVIAQALRMRGAEVAMLTCGGGQPLCEVGWSRRAHPRPCDRCGWLTDRVGEAAGTPHFRIADGLPWGPDGRAAPARPEAVGKGGLDPYRASEISAGWILKTTDASEVEQGEQVVADFAVAAAGVERAATDVLDRFRPDVVFMLGGLFAAERVVRELAEARGIRVTTYEMAQRADAIVISNDAPAGHFDTDAIWRRVRDRPLDREEEAALEEMISGRARGVGAHERYHRRPVDDPAAVRAALDIPADGRVVSLYTNLAWDSAVLGRGGAFGSMHDWIGSTVEAVRGAGDVTLVIRVHPGEAKWGTRQPAVTALPAELPRNVRFVGPDEELSSYALVALSDLVLVYATTVGLESAVRGTPTAVAGETHYRGKGFTLDANSADEWRALLGAGSWSMSEAQVELARRYAFTFFFRCLMPVPLVRLEEGHPAAVPTTARELSAGSDPYLDLLCARILEGGDFALPEELALGAPPASA
jgi:hypothetical protein